MDFVDTIRRRYRGGRDRLFLLHGNTSDLFPFTNGDGKEQLLTLPDYLYLAVSASAPSADDRVWMHFSIGFGVRWMNDPASNGSARVARLLGSDGSKRVATIREPIAFFRTVDEVCTRTEVVKDAFGERRAPIPLRIIVTEAHLVLPEAQPAFMRLEDRETLVLLKRFAKEPFYDATDTLIVCVTDTLSAIHRELREDAVTLEVPRPSEVDMGRFVERSVGRVPVHVPTKELPRLKSLASGLTYRQLENVLTETTAIGEPLTAEYLATRRKELVARDYGDHLEFFEPTWSLDDVGGSREAVAELRHLSESLARGERDIPSGIILAGQNGIGKTFIAKAFLGTAKIPGVFLKPFQDFLLGASERNWEKIATALRSAGQIGVLVDEADAQMGQRSGVDVHEVSKRIFAAQMQLMGDPRYRGRILWILMTCRPDRLAPDVKRPGRCERVIPLFPIVAHEDAAEMLAALVRNLTTYDGYRFADDMTQRANGLDPALLDAFIGRTGAQIERLLRRAKRRSGGDPVSVASLRATIESEKELDAEPEAYELQRLVAVVEAVETENDDLIPPFYVSAIRNTYGGVVGVKRRVSELRANVDGGFR
jgi:hypothetical protein